MIKTAKKQWLQPVLLVLVYLSYCAMNWYSSRGTLAYYAEHYGWKGWLANDVWAFFIGGIVAILLYTFISRSAKRALSLRIGVAAEKILVGMDVTIIVANVVLFALKFMYIAVPLAAPIVNIMIDPIVTVIFVALYLVFVYKKIFIAKPLFGAVASQIMSMFLTVYGILAVVNLIMAVVI